MDGTTLVDKLVRELAQSEFDARLHTLRQARRLGPCPPADALAAISEHATSTWPGFLAAAGRKRAIGIEIGRFVARVFSATRHFAVDLVIDAQRAYRGTLLGLVHGLDCARLLRAAAARCGEHGLARWCDQMLEDRVELLEVAANALLWFAEVPDVALHRAGSRRPALAAVDEPTLATITPVIVMTPPPAS